MNGDKIKGVLQKIGGHVEESAGALFGDENLKIAGQEDQIKGEAREAWGNVKDAGHALIDRARVAKADAELKSARAEVFDREHNIEVHIQPEPKAQPDAKAQSATESGPAQPSGQAQPDQAQSKGDPNSGSR
jgi:uncharacterized protein YjbJ (UPF0337 family)